MNMSDNSRLGRIVTKAKKSGILCEKVCLAEDASPATMKAIGTLPHMLGTPAILVTERECDWTIIGTNGIGSNRDGVPRFISYNEISECKPIGWPPPQRMSELLVFDSLQLSLKNGEEMMLWLPKDVGASLAVWNIVMMLVR